MKYVSSCLLAVLVVFVRLSYAQVTCECPKLACDPCSVEKGITFYSEKCGPDLRKVKSCGRPTCVPIEQATKECPVPPKADAGPREPIVVAASGGASKLADPNADRPIVGKVSLVSGTAHVVQPDGQKIAIVAGGTPVRETDTVETGAEGTALILFDGGNKVHVHAGTSLQVKEFKDQKSEDSRRALLHLIKGKVRNQVEQKYNGKTSNFRVITKGAVAGVRGTDFVVTHFEDQKMETRVETLEGRVVFGGATGGETRDLRRGEGAVFTAIVPRDELSEFVETGKLSPVYQIPAERLKAMDMDTRVDIAKAKKPSAPREVEICDKPKALFNQCAWTCAGNPAGEKKCRVDLPGVACVRSRCNGNGQWAEETRLPAATSDGLCPASGSSVKSCDY